MFLKRARRSMSKPPESLLRCSFCKRPKDQVKKLISGQGVYICDSCVELCMEIIEADRKLEAEAET